MAAAKQSIAITSVSANGSANSLPPFVRSRLRQLCLGVWQAVDHRRARWVQAHHDAVRGIAAKDYPPAVIEQWAPLPITEKHVERVRANPETEIRLSAEINDEIVGLGAIVLAKNELHACYAVPSAARKGVGSALVRELERIALEHGSNWTPHGHPNRSIWPSACVKMQKNLIPPTGVR